MWNLFEVLNAPVPSPTSTLFKAIPPVMRVHHRLLKKRAIWREEIRTHVRKPPLRCPSKGVIAFITDPLILRKSNKVFSCYVEGNFLCLVRELWFSVQFPLKNAFQHSTVVVPILPRTIIKTVVIDKLLR